MHYERVIDAALYLRVSLDGTGEGLAVERQGEDCRRLAAERGWAVVETYTDNSISASKSSVRRPGYDRLVEDYRAGRFGAVVCWDLDRLTRQPRQLEDWIDAAEQRGLLLATANGEADLSTDGGRLFARIKASVARAEVERKSARQKRAAAQRAELGRVPRGIRLTGYAADGTVVPSEARLVRGVFERFVAGDSLRSLAVWLGEVAPPRNGARWTSATVRTWLLNPRYAGRAVYCGKVTGHRGEWEAIVDDATFDAAQEKLSDPRRLTNRVGTDRRYLGSGVYRCGVCGERVRTASAGSYRCPVGGHVSRSARPVDELVEAVIAGRLALPDVAELLHGADGEQAAGFARDVAAVRGRLAQVERDYDDDLIDARRYGVKAEKLRAELTGLEQARARAVGSAALSSVLGGPDPAAAYRAAPLGVRRSVVDELVVVTLAPAPRGAHFDPPTVGIEWRATTE